MIKKYSILIAILLIATFLRVYELHKFPIELFGDEIDVGLQAYSILKTGKDYLSHPYPFIFQSFDEYRMPLLIYWTVPFIKIFGLNEWGVRLPSAMLGVFSVLTIFLLINRILNFKTAAFAALLMAVSPWSIHYSRWENDAIAILPLIFLGTYFFFKGLKKERNLIPSAVFFALTIYAYSISILFTPLFLMLLGFLYRNRIKNIRNYAIALVVFLILLTPYFYYFAKGATTERFDKISIFQDQGLIDRAIIAQSKNQTPLSKIFRNKIVVIGEEAMKNYLESFSMQFLFTKGDGNFRHSVGGMGQLYLFELLFLTTGMVVLFRTILTKKAFLRKEYFFILLWLLIAPVASALTKDGGFHTGRLLVMLPPLLIISSIGIVKLLNNFQDIKFRLLLYIVLILAAFNVSSYIYRYYIEWSKESWRFYQYGYKKAFAYINENDSKYQRIFFNNTYEPAFPRFLFWYKINPSEFQRIYKGKEFRKDIVPGFDGFKFGSKYYFGRISKLIKDEGFKDVLLENDIYFASKREEVGAANWLEEPPENLSILEVINEPHDKQPIFFIVKKKP